MDFLKEKKYLYWGGGFALLVIFWLAFGSESKEAPALFASPEKGLFKVDVTTTGELRAKNSTSIRGPEITREFRIFQIGIQRLVPEGTVVEKGDFVAELDRSDITSSFQNAKLDLQEVQSKYESAKLDSALTLSKARDNLVNLEYTLEEAKIAVEQSKYESPAVQRQVKIDYEQAKLKMGQERKNYKMQVRQAKVDINKIEADLKKQEQRVQNIEDAIEKFTIYAPENGMVIYQRNRNGNKVTSGSQISAWNPIVAKLPDFSVMNSVTYVNEVDIQKVRVGQKVDVGLDAMPDKELTGVVTEVANIGERRPNSDSKVFQVVIEINESDTTLRPAMTTSNTIHANSIDDALYVPLETIHTRDSRNYVFKREGLDIVMQQVVLGLMNENNVIIHEGISIGDQLYLSTPSDTTGINKEYLADNVLQKYQNKGGLSNPTQSGVKKNISEQSESRNSSF